jgi:uncharacterized protein CbrC (UPF0167 family)
MAGILPEEMGLHSPLPEFRLFARPAQFSTLNAEAGPCDLCGANGPVFTGPFHGEEEIETVCPACLASGRLAESGAWCNDGDFEELRSQIAAIQPGIKQKELDRIVEARLAEVMERTPPLTTWTEFPWPIRDGDFCRFEQEAGLEDLRASASADGSGDLAAWLDAHLDRTLSLAASAAALLGKIRPGFLANNQTYHPVGAYLFRSVVTGRAVVVVDAE